MTTTEESTDTPATPPEASHPWLPGSILRALGGLIDREADHEACRVLHVARVSDGVNEETGEERAHTIVEAIEGRVFIRARSASPVDENFLMDEATAQRFTPDDWVHVDGRTVVKPFRLEMQPDAGREDADDYPNLDPLVPKSDQRLLFVIDPKEMARALKAMSACGVRIVEVLQPEYRGGPLGLRSSDGSVTACVMPRDPFQARAQAADDVEGQQLFDFRDVGNELGAKESGITSMTIGVSSGGRTTRSVTIKGDAVKALNNAAKALRSRKK